MKCDNDFVSILEYYIWLRNAMNFEKHKLDKKKHETKKQSSFSNEKKQSRLFLSAGQSLHCQRRRCCSCWDLRFST